IGLSTNRAAEAARKPLETSCLMPGMALTSARRRSRRRCSDFPTIREVRWTGYSKKVRGYQGELVDKSEVQDLFLRKLAECSTVALRQDAEMRHVTEILWSIITAFSHELRHDIIHYAEAPY
ncbi:hypothetical protein, partial [Roseovarius sp. A46]|uniref:hypothetical protein n=1 Tax=Roseovarius sp. A46 TaxID=2109331 RepID=UPI0019D6CCA5